MWTPCVQTCNFVGTLSVCCGWQLTPAKTEAILHAINVRQGIHYFVATLLCCAGTSAQVERLPSKLKISDTDLASCYEGATGKFLGSQLVRSHSFVAPGGRYRAYVEVEAAASRSKALSDWDCASTSRLFVAAVDQPFREVLVVKPTSEAMGNSLGIIDWSPDGRTLLVWQGVFQWGSDETAQNFVRFYNAESGAISEPELVDGAFGARAGANCAVVIQPLGFSEYGQLVLKASPFFMLGEEKPVEDSCVKEQGLWLFDPATKKLVPLRQDSQVQRYGKFEALSLK
jgi:hypothetical protein